MKNAYVKRVWEEVKAKNPNEPEFLQAVEEVLATLEPAVDQMPELEPNAVLERLVEPERVIQFRVPWMDDAGNYHVNPLFEMKKACPDKTFIPLPPEMTEGVGCSCNECNYMRLSSLEKIYNVLKNETNEIFVDKEIASQALGCIDRMLEMSK